MMGQKKKGEKGWWGKKERSRGFETDEEREENRWMVVLGENKIARGEQVCESSGLVLLINSPEVIKV